MARASAAVLMTAAVLAAPACLRDGNAPDPSPCFFMGVFPTDAAPGSGSFSLVVGAEDRAARQVATVWKDGDHVALVAGGQGGFMIRPSIDVTAAQPLSEVGGQACLGVRMSAGPPSGQETYGGASATHVSGTAATYHVGALFGLLSSSRAIDGAPVEINFDVQQDGGGDGHARLTVVPDSTVAQ